MNQIRLSRISRIFGVGVVVIVLLVLLSFLGRFFYFLESVQEQEVGLQFRNNRIYRVVGPGVYSDFGLFVDLQTISTQVIPFQITDPEIITSDKQRIGLIVSGDIFRPDLAVGDLIRDNWSRYRGLYTDDLLATTRVQDLARQAMKVCVGDRTFDDNIIGTARDALRACIDTELNNSLTDIGLRVENLVVPEVILSAEVQTALDAIVQSRLSTEKAAQDQLKALAEALSEQERQEGEIRIEQSRIQEQTRQQILLAQLEKERLDAQLEVIESTRINNLTQLDADQQVLLATKENELFGVQEDLAIAEVLVDVAAAEAEAQTAVQAILAALYAQNPEYVQLLFVQANAGALNATDKIIFTPEGTIPTIVLPGPGIVPTVDTNPTATDNGTGTTDSTSDQ